MNIVNKEGQRVSKRVYENKRDDHVILLNLGLPVFWHKIRGLFQCSTRRRHAYSDKNTPVSNGSLEMEDIFTFEFGQFRNVFNRFCDNPCSSCKRVLINEC